MSEANDQSDKDSEAPVVDELSLLKTRARMMGLDFSNNIGLEKLREKINAKMAGDADPVEAPAPAKASAVVEATVNPLSGLPAGEPIKKETPRQFLQRTQMKLVRLRITNLDPKKKDLPGEIFTVANRFLGTVRKFIPYGEVTDDGYHVPWVIYQELESRRFLHIRTIPARNGRQVQVTSTWAKEFALEVLPDLTQAELTKLGNAQQAAGVFASE